MLKIYIKKFSIFWLSKKYLEHNAQNLADHGNSQIITQANLKFMIPEKKELHERELGSESVHGLSGF